jgi:hypothetical protein
MSELARDFTLAEVAEALGMSERWLRARVNGPDAAEHTRYGHKIRFTAEQVEKLRAAHTKAPKPEVGGPVTTGRKRKSA